MGSRTDLAEREVAAQRVRISRMLGDLEERVHDDVKGIGDAVGERTSELQERVTGAVDELPGRQTLDEQVARHPLTAVLAGVGAGVALGVASGYIFRGGDSDDYESGRPQPARRTTTGGTEYGRERGRERSQDGGSGMMDAFAAAALSSIAAPLKDELQTLARQALAGFLGNKPDRAPSYRATSERATADERRAALAAEAGDGR